MQSIEEFFWLNFGLREISNGAIQKNSFTLSNMRWLIVACPTTSNNYEILRINTSLCLALFWYLALINFLITCFLEMTHGGSGRLGWVTKPNIRGNGLNPTYDESQRQCKLKVAFLLVIVPKFHPTAATEPKSAFSNPLKTGQSTYQFG